MAETIIAALAAAISLGALIVAGVARRDARRSADAAEESARHARRSADADERAVELAAREAEQRALALHEADGPTFEQVEGRLDGRTGRVALRVVAGPGRVTVSAEIVDAPWCLGFHTDGGEAEPTADCGELESGETLRQQVVFAADRGQDRELVLPVVITAVSHEDPPRTWVRRISVEMKDAPRVWVMRG